jgi:hypothetical protein
MEGFATESLTPTVTPPEEGTSKFDPKNVTPSILTERLRGYPQLSSDPNRTVTKATLMRAIKEHCRECCGFLPTASRPCGGDTLLDGVVCALVGWAENEFNLPKAGARRAVKRCCVHCMGGRFEGCASPGCKLYPHRFGRKARRGELIGAT